MDVIFLTENYLESKLFFKGVNIHNLHLRIYGGRKPKDFLRAIYEIILARLSKLAERFFETNATKSSAVRKVKRTKI